MKLSPMQRKALFEHLKSAGKLKTAITTAPKPPATPQLASTKVSTDADKVNSNYVGNVRPSRFKKIKNMFGM